MPFLMTRLEPQAGHKTVGSGLADEVDMVAR